MKVVFSFIILALIFPVSVFAETVSQASLQSLGFEGFENNGAQAQECKEYSLAKDWAQNSQEFYTVFSLHALFEPVASKDANVQVFLNGEEAAQATAEEFLDGWLRVAFPNAQLQQQNKVFVCLQNSLSTTRSRVFSDSLFGTYKMADFKETGFVKTISDPVPDWGQEFEVTVSLHNSGSESADVNILYQKPGISFKHLAFVKGESGFVGKIAPNETVSFSYVMKSTKLGPFSLPGAIVFFK